MQEKLVKNMKKNDIYSKQDYSKINVYMHKLKTENNRSKIIEVNVWDFSKTALIYSFQIKIGIFFEDKSRYDLFLSSKKFLVERMGKKSITEIWFSRNWLDLFLRK